MQQIPTLIQDLALTRLTNAVYVGTMKFTYDEVKKFKDSRFTTENPAPAKLTAQLTDFRYAYERVNDAYALTLRSAITDQIAALDTEGDQLIYAVKGIVEAAQRMTFDTEKVQRANYYAEFLKKYKIDPTENMISEWSKVQQACEEADMNAQVDVAATKLGIKPAIVRLGVIADTIRAKITQRSSELPEAQQMKNARAAMDPEYKALVLIINSLAVCADSNYPYGEIIKTLNQNITYVKTHAISKAGSGEEVQPEEGGESEDGGQQDGGSQDGSQDEVTPVKPE